MRTLNDADLLRIAGLNPPDNRPQRLGDIERSTRMIRGLRRAIELLPSVALISPPPAAWMIFGTAVVIAFTDSDRSGNKFAPAHAVESVMSQLGGLLKGEDFSAGELYAVLDAAADKHWLEGENRGHDESGFRATLLGESLAQSATVPPTVAGLSHIPSRVDRVKAFRNALNAFLAPLFVQNANEYEVDFKKHAAIQDAWIDLSDIVSSTSASTNAIYKTVTVCTPENAYETWRAALRQVGELIVSVGRDEKLEPVVNFA